MSNPKIRKKDYWIDLDKSTIKIAIVQIKGPFLDFKRKVVSQGREVLEWADLADIELRINKVLNILDELSQLEENKPEVVVFPEYSFPSFTALPQIVERADKYGFIVIAGADSFREDSGKIYNKSPIIIPKKKSPIFVTKRKISKWEIGLVDIPDEVVIPTLKWKVGEKIYWISPYICLEFEQAPLEQKKGGGIFIVSMCSPEILTFYMWADALLRLENGTATILCNCGDDQNKGGNSGVIAVVPGGSAASPALKLPEKKECVAIVEINCQFLYQPIKTNPDFPPPIGNRYIYNLHFLPEGIKLLPAQDTPRASAKRGVINPAIYEFLGKTMRIAFLSIPKYADVSEKVKGQEFEVLAILGHHDLMVTHLTSDKYDMIVDISNNINWRMTDGAVAKSENAKDVSVQNRFPHFRVDSYFKVLGEEVSEKDRNIIGANKPFPSLPEIIDIMKLGNDWDAPGIDDISKSKFRKNKWILNVSDKIPGIINGIMTIHLEHADVDQSGPQLAFEEEVIPHLVKNNSVTSIYKGVGHGLRIDYILRLALTFKSSDLSDLYDLIETVHAASKKARVLISSTTYVAVKKLSDLSLQKVALIPQIPSGEKKYRDAQILFNLSSEEKVKLLYMNQDEQVKYIQMFRKVQEALAELYNCSWRIRFDFILSDLASGLLETDWILLKNVHENIYTFVENELKNYIENSVTSEFLNAHRDELQIKSGIKKDKLSYTERINLVISYLEETNADSELLSNVLSLRKTITVRNAFAHTDWERVTPEIFVDAIIIYCEFLKHWHQCVILKKV